MQDETGFGSEPDSMRSLAFTGAFVDELEGSIMKPPRQFSQSSRQGHTRTGSSRRPSDSSHDACATASPHFPIPFYYVPKPQRQGSEGGRGRELPIHLLAPTPGDGLFKHRDREVSNILRAYWTNLRQTEILTDQVAASREASSTAISCGYSRTMGHLRGGGPLVGAAGRLERRDRNGTGGSAEFNADQVIDWCNGRPREKWMTVL